MAVDGAGNVYVSDLGNYKIRKITSAGVVTTLAASFSNPEGVAVDSAGNIYVADAPYFNFSGTYSGGNTIEKITPSGVASTLAGLSGSKGSADGTGSDARFDTPLSVAVDGAGNVYVADSGNSTIRMITPSGIVSTLAGLAGSSGSTDGTGSDARLISPGGVAVDSAGNVYVADMRNYTIRMITPSGIASSLGGRAGSVGSTDGTGSEARFSFPSGVAVGSAGNVYVADSGNNTIRVGVKAPATRLANISTRARVGTGDSVMIGGFIITGTETKTVIVRGIGPSVPLPGALPDPVIEVYDSNGKFLASNDNWKDAATRQEIMDSGLAPTNDLEAALWGVINPGAYTVVVHDRSNTTGIGLFEVYDLDQAAGSRLANISTRGFVDTGDNILIGGTIVTGNGPANVLVRAIGPSLTKAGVSNALQDPKLDLYNSQGQIIASDDNWKDSQQADIAATTIPPSDDRESAILRTLPPGQYTATVRGVNGTSGVAVVEAYQLDY